MIYDGMKSENKIRLEINGVPIPKLSDYSYFDAKSFFTEPVRSALGVINDLNGYATFLTPRLKFSFKLMPIETYRTLMKLIKEYNEFIVTAYDIVEDKYVTRKMYFYPKDFPQIFQHSLEVLAVLDEGFELVGTNDDVDELSIVYNSNSEPVTTSGLTFLYGNEVRIGDYDNADGAGVDPTAFTRDGYVLKGWNTKPDGTGFAYATGAVIMPTVSMVLYAQWVPTTTFVLTFDYQGATSGNDVVSKEVSSGALVGDLPTPAKDGLTFVGWYTLSNGAGTKITSSTIFDYNRNMTLYAYWAQSVVIG